MSRPLVSLALTALLFAVVPAVAEAKNYKGKTSQRYVVKVRTGADAVVNRAQIGWRAPCGQGLRYRSDTTFRPPLDAATGDAITDSGTYRERMRGGVRARITITLAGQRDPATDRWSGTLAVKVLVSRRGKVIDSCELKRASWTAR